MARPTWWPPLTLIALSLPVLFCALGRKVVTQTVEERVAVTSREMLHAREWILPTLGGEIRLQKPPLAYWLVMGSAKALGAHDELSLRLPFALCALLTALAVLGAGALSAGGSAGARQVGALAGLVLLTAALFVKEAHAASADGPLVMAAAGASLCCLLSRARERSTLPRMGFYVCLGVGALAKGPVILVVTVLPILVEAVVMRSTAPLRVLASPAGIVAFLAIALAWPVLAVWRLRGDGGAMEALRTWWLESFGKMGASEGVEDGYSFSRHPGPWHFHLLRLPAAFGVWTPALPFALYACVREIRGSARKRVVSPLCHSALAFLVILAFFSAIREKKSAYLLPAMPHGAVLVASVLASGYDRYRKWLRLGLVIAAAGFLPAACVLFILVRSGVAAQLEEVLRSQGAAWFGIGAFVAASFLVVARELRRGGFFPPWAVLLGSLCIAMGPSSYLRWTQEARDYPVRERAVEARALFRDGQPLFELGNAPSGFLYYIDRRVKPLAARDPKDVWEAVAKLPAGSGIIQTPIGKEWSPLPEGVRLLADLQVGEEPVRCLER